MAFVYNKIFTKILDSSIWLEAHPTRIVWLTFLAAMDQDGFAQFASPANVAHRARVSPEEADDAIRVLTSPDPNSSDPDNEGRRLERVNGGWVVLNAHKYRELVSRAIASEKTRERVAKFREKHRIRPLTGDHPSSPTPPPTSEAESKQSQIQKGIVTDSLASVTEPLQTVTKPKFSPPTESEWTAAAKARFPDWPSSNVLSAFNHYVGNGWRTGKNPVKDWAGCVGACYHRWRGDQPGAIRKERKLANLP